MSRYRALRMFGLGPLGAAWFAFLNVLWGIPKGKAAFKKVEIDYETEGDA